MVRSMAALLLFVSGVLLTSACSSPVVPVTGGAGAEDVNGGSITDDDAMMDPDGAGGPGSDDVSGDAAMDDMIDAGGMDGVDGDLVDGTAGDPADGIVDDTPANDPTVDGDSPRQPGDPDTTPIDPGTIDPGTTDPEPDARDLAQATCERAGLNAGTIDAVFLFAEDAANSGLNRSQAIQFVQPTCESFCGIPQNFCELACFSCVPAAVDAVLP